MRGIKRESLAEETLEDIVRPLIDSGVYEEYRQEWLKEFQSEVKKIKRN